MEKRVCYYVMDFILRKISKKYIYLANFRDGFCHSQFHTTLKNTMPIQVDHKPIGECSLLCKRPWGRSHSIDPPPISQ